LWKKRASRSRIAGKSSEKALRCTPRNERTRKRRWRATVDFKPVRGDCHTGFDEGEMRCYFRATTGRKIKTNRGQLFINVAKRA
jgi:hypothetical protein